MTYEKFDSLLSGLDDTRRIAGYENHCRSDIRYLLKFRREDLKNLQDSGRLSRFLKMEERESENFTVLDENGELKIFRNSTEIIQYFVKFRLTYYIKRKAHLIERLTAEANVLTNKARFIQSIVDGQLKINNVSRRTIILYLETADFDEVNGSYSYLLTLPIHTLTKEQYDDLLEERDRKLDELDEIRHKEPIVMYRDDLVELRKALVKSYA
jgi:DNA topoisomerase-2